MLSVMRAVCVVLVLAAGCGWCELFEPPVYYEEEARVEEPGPSGWYCYRGTFRGRDVGECRETLDQCAKVVESRRGVMFRNRCQHYRQAACFNGTRSLEKGAKVYCFPAPEQCVHYREKALDNGLLGVTDCGLLS